MRDDGVDSAAPEEDFEDLYENAPCGYLSMLPNGRICRVNRTFLAWTGHDSSQLIGRPLRDFLPIAGRIFYETHFAPLLRIQGFYNEVALDILMGDGSRIPVLANAVERRDGDGTLMFTRLTLFPATDRRRFERSLVDAQVVSDNRIRVLEETSDLREQFVAVLGHDLRNPLASISSGVRMLSKSATGKDLQVLEFMRGSVTRMAGLIDNVMDFARSRLGEGIGLELRQTGELATTLAQVIAELAAVHPDREIITEIQIDGPVLCDASRIGQMVSNLLGNALTHGLATAPVRLRASNTDGNLEIEVCNAGEPIPQEKLERLFRPFFRGEASGVKEGLGLGLFIASEIAGAHGGALTATSDPDETCFRFRLRIKPPT